MSSTSMPNLLPRRLHSILAVAHLLLAVAYAQPARFPCGTTSPNQRVCDLLSHPTARRGTNVPVDSECTKDSQCDFGLCSGDDAEPGVCIGGLGDLCEGPNGPDDSLCMGNLGCQRRTDGVLGKARCGGSGADCSYNGAYEQGTRPNHQACMSGHCSTSTLTCSTKNAPPPGRPMGRPDSGPQSGQQRIDRIPRPGDGSSGRQRAAIPEPAGQTCPTGFTLCPTRARRGEGGGFEFACVDTKTSLTHCGGCPSIGAGFWDEDGEAGVNCMKVEGVASAACVDSTCRIFSCDAGYEFDRATGGCAQKKYW
ncbi:hypothetical protein JCM6882_000619 [Rhodosporidiobolus microsporus]